MKNDNNSENGKKVLLKDALSIVRECTKELDSQEIPVAEACGRIAAKDVVAELSQPPFRKSAMDGYAIRSCDATPGCLLEVSDEADAGDTRILEVPAGKAIRIMTGARIPENADMVVPQEMTDYGEEYVRIDALPKRSNICSIGEDFEVGTVLVKKDAQLTASSVSCLTAAGVERVYVIRKPVITVICTGDELVSPGNKLKSGQIYDSNGAYLKTRLTQLGCVVNKAVTVSDDEELITNEVKDAVLKSDFVITAGGVSVGKKDYMERILLSLGAEIKFHGVRVKPGMPTMFSVLDGVPVYSLSGNPYSMAALFEYAFPYKRSITLQARLSEPFENSYDISRLVRGYYNGCTVELAQHQRNGSTWSDVEANCIAELTPNMAMSDTVKVILI